jgi:hypothetical protein
MKLASASVVLVLLLAGLAQADVINGTFSAPLSGTWDAYTDGTADVAIDNIYGGSFDVLHLSATTSYEWDSENGGWYNTSSYGTCDVMQFALEVPFGADTLSFDASAYCTGASLVGSISGANPSVLVTISYLKNNEWVQGIYSIPIDSSDSASLSHYSITIDADANSLADISIALKTSLDPSEPNEQELATLDVSVNAWIDNIAFAAPEPATMILLALGLPLFMRKRSMCRRMVKNSSTPEENGPRS